VRAAASDVEITVDIDDASFCSDDVTPNHNNITLLETGVHMQPPNDSAVRIVKRWSARLWRSLSQTSGKSIPVDKASIAVADKVV
jgi:hypothetical protein